MRIQAAIVPFVLLWCLAQAGSGADGDAGAQSTAAAAAAAASSADSSSLSVVSNVLKSMARSAKSLAGAASVAGARASADAQAAANAEQELHAAANAYAVAKDEYIALSKKLVKATADANSAAQAAMKAFEIATDVQASASSHAGAGTALSKDSFSHAHELANAAIKEVMHALREVQIARRSAVSAVATLSNAQRKVAKWVSGNSQVLSAASSMASSNTAVGDKH